MNIVNQNFNMFNTEKPPSRVYRRIGYIFIFSTVIMLVVVMYMALSKATIVVEPKVEAVSADLLITVKEKDLRGGDILGKVEMVTVWREASFPASGAGEESPAKAAVSVTVFNDYTKSQTLIATTRFLSKSGVLFRLQKTITVPAGGSISAKIMADKEGKSGEIGPTTFTIPGLAASLQTEIYAKSAEAAAGGVTRVGIVTEKDINDAVQNIHSSLLAEASSQLKKTLNGGGQFAGVVFTDSFKIKIASVAPGEKASEFKVKVELDVTGAAYSAALENQAAQTLAGMISSDKKLVSSNILDAVPVIEKYDIKDGSANLKVSLTGQTIISADSPVFDKKKMAGLSGDEVKNYLEKYAGIKNVEVKFFPFWIDRVPKLRDHIKVIVQ